MNGQVVTKRKCEIDHDLGYGEQGVLVGLSISFRVRTLPPLLILPVAQFSFCSNRELNDFTGYFPLREKMVLKEAADFIPFGPSRESVFANLT